MLHDYKSNLQRLRARILLSPSLSLYISFSRLPSFAFLCLPCQMTQKLITTQARAKAKTMTATRLFACHSSALPHVGRGGQGRKGNVDVGRKKCSGYLLRARNIFTHVNSIKRSIMATPPPPQAFYVPHGAWPMEFVLHTLRGDSVAHSHQHQHTHTQTDKNLPRLLFAMPKDFANAARSMPPPV